MRKHKRIQSIRKTILYHKPKYEIILMPNYSFECSGSQLCYCESIRELYELTQSIIYCDGVTISR